MAASSKDLEPQKKRKEDTWDVSNIEESFAAIVSELITQVSPIKSSEKNANVRYFNGRISDGKQTARIICFDPSLHQAVDQALKNRSSISRIYTVPTENFADETSSKQISISELSDLSTTVTAS